MNVKRKHRNYCVGRGNLQEITLLRRHSVYREIERKDPNTYFMRTYHALVQNRM